MYEAFDEFDSLDEGDPFLGSLVSKIPWGKLAHTAGKSVLGSLGGILGEEPVYFDGESYEDFEAEYLNGDAAVMEVLAAEAAEAESEEEADAFIGALLPLALNAIPKIAPAAAKIGQQVLPSLVSGAKNLVATLWKNPSTRHLIQTIPTIARGTAATIARQAAAGRPVTAQTAVRALAGQAAKVLQNPKRSTAIVKRCRHTAARKKAAAHAFA
jgi:transposase